jgi:hypothetical protein
VVIATHRASGCEYVLEEPDQWPITRVIHAPDASNTPGDHLRSWGLPAPKTIRPLARPTSDPIKELSV